MNLEDTDQHGEVAGYDGYCGFGVGLCLGNRQLHRTVVWLLTCLVGASGNPWMITGSLFTNQNDDIY